MIERIKHISLMMLTLVVISAPVAAQDGGTQSVFSELGVGSRAIGLGNGFSSIADDASSLYWNPAALRNVQQKQIMVMYMPLFGDFTGATYSYLGGVYPTLNAGSFGLGFQRIAADFDAFDASSVPLGTQNYSESQILIGYAFERHFGFLDGALAAGANVKIANQQIADLSSTSPGLDLGFRYNPDFAKTLMLGINFQDLVGPAHKLNQEEDKTDRLTMLGLGYSYIFSNGSALRLLGQLDLPQRADSRMHAGVEYAFARYASLRLGYDAGAITFGLGVNVSNFGFDYALLNKDEAGNSNAISFTARWGNTLQEQRDILAKQQEERDRELIAQAFNRRVQVHRDQALQDESNGDIPAALDEWKIVLEYVPGDQQATDKMTALTAALVAEQEQSSRNLESQATISAHFSQGLRFYQGSEYVRAREEWFAILAIDPNHAEAQDYLARTQLRIDEQLQVHETRARQLESAGRLTEAMSEWSNVELLDPGDAEAAAAVIRIQRRIENQSSDLAETERRLKIVNLYNTSLQAYNQGQYQQAITGLDELLRLEPGHQEAQTLHAMAQRKLTPLTREEEAQIRGYYLKGMEFFSKDQYSDAIREWEKILKIDPTNESVKRNIEEAQQRLKQLGN